VLGETAEDLYEHAPCGYVSTLLDGTIIKANRTFLSLIGRRREDVVGGMRFQDLLTPGARLYHETNFAQRLQLAGAVREIAIDIACADGTRRPVIVHAVLRRDADGAPLLVRTALFEAMDRREYESELRRERDRARAARRIAERLQAELAERAGELERLAYTDPLTGVANRRAADEHLRRAVAQVRRHGGGLGVALADLDRFKVINDAHGHQGGDAALCEVAARMRKRLREEDLLGRWGGEEFLLIAPATGPSGVEALAEELRAAVAAAPVAYGERSIPVTVSIGWTTWDDDDSPEMLVARADRALYAAKEAGRDTVRGGCLTA
jgi:diguanylate cyclase (GGDEF)-like protein/PAS domain S-box-containing protein